MKIFKKLIMAWQIITVFTSFFAIYMMSSALIPHPSIIVWTTNIILVWILWVTVIILVFLVIVNSYYYHKYNRNKKKRIKIREILAA